MTPTARRALRVNLGLTQARLSTLFGTSRATIIRAEAEDGADITPPIRKLYRLLDRFGADAVAVLGEAEEPDVVTTAS